MKHTFKDLKLNTTYIVKLSYNGSIISEIVVLKKKQNVTFVHYNPENNGSKCWELNTKEIYEIIESFPTENENDNIIQLKS